MKGGWGSNLLYLFNPKHDTHDIAAHIYQLGVGTCTESPSDPYKLGAGSCSESPSDPDITHSMINTNINYTLNKLQFIN